MITKRMVKIREIWIVNISDKRKKRAVKIDKRMIFFHVVLSMKHFYLSVFGKFLKNACTAV